MLYHICKIAFSPLCSLSLCSFGVFQSVQNKRPGNAGYPLPDPLRLKTQFRYLLPLEDVFLIYDSILMVMAEKPVGEFTPLADHFKKVRQFIRSIGWIDLLHHTAGSAVGENTVYRPVDSFQVCQGSWYSAWLGISSAHQLTPFTRNMDRIRRISQYRCSKSGAAGSRTPS